MTKEDRVPVFKLYGEQGHWPTPDMLHCETIAVRSKLYNWHIKPHQHVGLFQMLFLKGGSAVVQLDEQHHDLTEGQLLMVPQMCIHGFKFSADAEGYVITFAYPLLNKIVRQMGSGLPVLNSPSMHFLSGDRQSRHIKMAFKALHEEYKANALHRNILIESLLGMILIWVDRHSSHHALKQPREMARGGRHFSRFCELMEESYIRHCPVAYYAKEIGVTAAHLNVLCRQAVDKSALELIHERLMLEAKRNLVYTAMTISEVSYAIGFSDPAYFTRFFKREVGLSPKDFRKQAGT